MLLNFQQENCYFDGVTVDGMPEVLLVLVGTRAQCV